MYKQSVFKDTVNLKGMGKTKVTSSGKYALPPKSIQDLNSTVYVLFLGWWVHAFLVSSGFLKFLLYYALPAYMLRYILLYVSNIPFFKPCMQPHLCKIVSICTHNKKICIKK